MNVQTNVRKEDRKTENKTVRQMREKKTSS